jgi:hypothetical protein
VNDVPGQNECFLHGNEGREPWGTPFRGIEVVRCDHLGEAYVVEMHLVAGSEECPHRSHHIHFVRDGRREVHALDEDLSPGAVDEVWRRVVDAMECGESPNANIARFHARASG